jgi:hypothetical protein
MLFAVFEIVFFLLLATLLGAFAGWWLARSGRVSVTKAMDRSGAHAAADRELASAREEIARLSTKLNVATEAIRELETGHRRRTPEPVSELDASLPEVPAAPAGLRATEERAVPSRSSADASDGADTASTASTHTESDVTVTVAGSEDPLSNGLNRGGRTRGGKRLSERVAEASPFMKPDRPAPTIKFDDDSD